MNACSRHGQTRPRRTLACGLLAGLIVGLMTWLNVGSTQSAVYDPVTHLPLASAVRLQRAPDNPEVVPDVVGAMPEVAVERLSARDFIARIVSGPVEDPRARVTGQDPPGGARPPRDRIVRLWVGIAMDEQLVPDVVGEFAPQAVERLASQDFIGRIVSGPAEDPRARVTGQDPPRGARPPRDRIVRLWVGVAEQRVEVPPVEGQSAAEAERIIQRHELKPVFVDGEVPGDSIVVDQQPDAGAFVSPGSAVRLQVELRLVEVPPVADMPLAEAVRTLRRHRLQADIDRDGAGRADRVIDHKPEAGDRVAAGSRVFLRTQAPEALAIVPDVMNLAQDAAFREIQAAGLTPRVSGDRRTRGGDVIRQEPLGGTEVRPGTRVTLWLSAPSGPPGGGRDRGDRDLGDQSGDQGDRHDAPRSADDGDGRNGIDPDLLIALTVGLGALAIGGLVLRRISSRRKPRKRRSPHERITFDPHPVTPDARADAALAVRTEIRLEPVCDARGEQALDAQGALVSNWEELP